MSHIHTRIEDGIYHIAMDRSAKKHALTHAMYQRMHEAVTEAENDAGVRVIFITGHDGIFTAGNDLEDFLEHPPKDENAPVYKLMQSMLNAAKPIVAAVSGVAVGIGTTMLLHCDLIYADDTARFRLPFVNLGLCPEFGSSVLFPMLAGYHRAAELLLLGEVFDAERAQQIGLVNKILPAAELQDYALARARQLAAQPAVALRLSKTLMKRSLMYLLPELLLQEYEHFVDCLDSAEAREAMLAFKEKRKPDFSRFQ